MNRFRIFLPSMADTLFVSLFLYLSFFGQALLNDADTGYHIRTGEFILRTHSIPRHDMFSFTTPPLPWTTHEWLSEVIMALLHTNFGLTGVVIFFAFLISLTFYLFFKSLRASTGNILLAVLTTLVVIASAKVHWLARPHIFSMLLTVIWYALLDSYQYLDRNRLYLFPPLMLLWVNLHGGFITGFILLGLYLLGNLVEAFAAPPERKKIFQKRVKVLSVITAWCLLASLANPFGYRILLFPFNLVSNRFIMDHVMEFLSPDFHEPLMFKYLLLTMVGVFAISKAKLNMIELGLILLFTNMALYSARYIPLFAIIAAPVILRQIAMMIIGRDGKICDFLRRKSSEIASMDISAKGYSWPIIAIIAVVFCVAGDRVRYGFDPGKKPVTAVEFLKKERIQGNMFDNDEFGDYIIYAAWPDYRVFFDGRSDMYGDARFKEYFNVVNIAPDWEKILIKYKIDWVFYDAESVLSRHLLKNEQWRLVYADKVANIFVRNVAKYQYLITKYRDVKPVHVNKSSSADT